MIVSALKKSGFKIDLDFIKLDQSIKEVGEYKVRVQLPFGFEAELRLIIEEK